jgi:hypothetical protein
MVISEGDGHVDSVHSAEVAWDKLRGERFREGVGTLRGNGLRVIGVTTLGSNGALVMSRA